MELDQMAAPVAPTMNNLVSDGFAFGDRSVYDNEGNYLPGTWDTIAPANEPVNFDVLAQPAKPDISLLTTAMAAACVEVKEVSQDPKNWIWITDENGDLKNGGWRTETPFVHNLAAFSNDAIMSIAQPSRDVAQSNNEEFWCVQGIGAYDADPGWNYDGINDGWCTGIKAGNDTVFLVFSETTRDIAATKTGVTKTALEIGALSTMHETLHVFGFVDYGNPNYDVQVDGLIMTTEIIKSTLSNAEIAKLSAKQIQKIQSNNKPT
jgi:hypothetical protein